MRNTGRPCPRVSILPSNFRAISLAGRFLRPGADISPAIADAAYRRAVANLTEAETDLLERKVGVYIGRLEELASATERRLQKRGGGSRGSGSKKPMRKVSRRRSSRRPPRRGRLG
jgi:hypothetical protein